jgi:hypothetical protein
MADSHEDFPRHPLDVGVPGGLPLLNFPEISMFGMCPWGGFGANPAPAHFQGLWNRIKHVARGGAPYSEGVYEDMNKAIVAGLYWEPDRAAEDIVREYCAFEFSPEVADDLVEVTRIFERNHDRKRIGADTVRALELVQGAEPAMTKAARRSWRWRIFHLRALIDKELHERQGQMAGTVLESAFDELTGIYHAQGVHTAPLRPPQVQAESGDGEKRA